MEIKLEKVLERDIDLLLINKFINDKNFKNIFLSKINKTNFEIISIEHSAMNEYGESDIVVILQNKKNKIALLIEDKIKAIAMPQQYERYIKRGNNDVALNKFNEFFTFIVAPKSYLETNTEALNYKNKISYEELFSYLKQDYYAVKLLTQAINEEKAGYVVVENIAVTTFWKNYYKFIKSNYPNLRLKEINGPRGSKACWSEFKTPFKNIKIIHKSNKGYVDLTFPNSLSKYDIIYNKFKNYLGENIKIDTAGKSIVIRIRTPIIDFKQDFYSCLNQTNIALNAVNTLLELSIKVNLLDIYTE